MTAPDILASPIDDHLGPRTGRFFGEGYKRIGHRVTDVEIGRGPDPQYARARASLTYPGDWSRKASGPLQPHLSSVDALVLAVQLAEAFLTHRYGLDVTQRRTMWLRSFDMRGGSAPQEDLTAFDVRALRLASMRAPGRRHASTFLCLVGTLTLTCEIEHDVTRRAPRDGAYRRLTDLLGPPGLRYYGSGYRRRSQLIDDVRVDPDGRRVEAGVTLTEAEEGPDLGLAGAYSSSPSMIDALVCLAQLAQVLAYRLDGIERGASNTLWMRRLAQRAAPPAPDAEGPLAAALSLQRSRRLRFGGGHWRTLDVVGDLGGIHVRSSIAHQLPSA